MKIAVKGLDCPHCASNIEQDLKKLAHVVDGKVSIFQELITLDLEGDTDPQELYEAVEDVVHRHEPRVVLKLKQSPAPVLKDDEVKADSCCSSCDLGDVLHAEEGLDHHESSHEDDHVHDNRDAYWLIAGVATWGIGLLLPFRYQMAVYVVAYVLMSHRVIIEAIRKLFSGVPLDENLLMTVASVGAMVIGEVHEGLAVMALFQLGEILEHRAVDKSKASLKALLDLQPDACFVERDGEWVQVEARDVPVGSLMMIKPGEKIALDGKVMQGDSYVDTSALTGESVPVAVKPGDQVMAGMTNRDGLLYVESTRDYDHSAVAKLMALIEEAVDGKAKPERFVTRFARVFTPLVFTLAVLLAFGMPLITGDPWSMWIYRALTFLVISCPCALVLSIPLAYFSGIGAASRKGVLVKGGQYLDQLAKVDTFVFDKTGTLTSGVFQVESIEPANGFSKEELLSIAAAGEATSTHPLAEAVIRAYGTDKLPDGVEDAKNIPGKGISYMLKGTRYYLGSGQLMEDLGFDVKAENRETVMYLATDEAYLGMISLRDEIKPDAKAFIERLKSQGIYTLLLSGDRHHAVSHVAEALGLDEYRGDLLPEDKLIKIKDLSKEGHRVAFVGDGINDGPAMAQSHVGLAMGDVGSAGTIEVADFVIMGDSMKKVGATHRLAKRTALIVKENLIFILTVKVGFLLLGALGIANIWMAVFGDVGVALISVLNSSRLMKLKQD